MVNRLRALRLLTILLVLAAVGGARMLAQPPAVTIDTLMAAPFPTELVAAPAGGAIAWVSSASGVNNVWVAERARPQAARRHHLHRRRRPVDHRAGMDERREDHRLRARRQRQSPGRVAQPRAAAGRHRSGRVRVAVAGGHPRRLGPGSGRRRVAAGHARRVGVARTDLERRLAGTDKPGATGQRARQRVQPLAGRPTDRCSRSAAIAARTATSASSRWPRASCAISILARSRRQRRCGRRTDRASRGCARRAAPRPRDVLAAPDSRRTVVAARRRREDRQAREVWKADAGYGSAFQAVVADSQLYWGAGDRLVFPWEKDGWLHLYSRAGRRRQGDAAHAGQFRSRVRRASSPDRRAVIYQLQPGRHRSPARLDGAGRRIGEAARSHDRSAASSGSRSSTSDGSTAALPRPTRTLPPHVDGDGTRRRRRDSLLENMLPDAFPPRSS